MGEEKWINLTILKKYNLTILKNPLRGFRKKRVSRIKSKYLDHATGRLEVP